MIDIVTALSQNEATVCGRQLRRPGSMCGVDWQRFWRHGAPKQDVQVDWWKALAFGVSLPRPPGVTGSEWVDFWQQRTNLRVAI